MDFNQPKLLNSEFTDDNVLRYSAAIPKVDNDGVISSCKVPLTTKRAVELLLEGTLRSKVCRYCLTVASPLSDLDQIMQIAGQGTLYKVSVREMVACFHPFKAYNDPNFPRKICNKCLNRTMSAYLFTQQCDQSERALKNCFEDMFTKLEKLDPLDKTKKRGRQKLNPNYNVLYANHERVMDYAEPNRHIVNTKCVSLSNEKYISELECLKCWQIFTKVEDLVIHEKTHPASMWFNCRLCGKSFVKRLQLKRHLKQAHLGPEMEPEENHIFQCGTCGFSCDDHRLHLQHIEKHKFQSVLEHLVEKKMDKLCTVCLDKKPKLVELDKMVRLHGGYPGVTGDRSLYSILGSTLPDQKSYKYQELYVPHHARIMKFAKLNKNKVPQAEDLDSCEDNDNKIIISNPLVISNDKLDTDEIYLFFFSDPSHYIDKDISPENNKTSNDIIAPSAKDPDQNGSIIFSENTSDNTDNTTFVIEKETETDESGTNIEIKDIDNTTAINLTPCKSCWIFKKPTCMVCNDTQKNISNVDDNKDNNPTKDKCHYCWLFKTSVKCEICKKLINDNTTTYPTNTTMIDKPISHVQRKRRMNDADIVETKPKNKKWDCQICLTTNMDERMSCICCEFKRNNLNDALKINLESKHPFKIFKPSDAIEDNISLQVITTSHATHPEDKVTLETENPAVDLKDLASKNSMHFENKNYMSTGNNSNIHVLEESTIDTEEMDTTEDYNQVILPPNPNPFSFITHFSNITAEPNNVGAQLSVLEQSSCLVSDSGLKFSIGAGSSKTGTGRRIMRPIRRMAYHK